MRFVFHYRIEILTEEALLKTLKLGLLALFALLVSCSPGKEALKKTLVENPEIIYEVIKKHPVEFLEVLNNAAREAQRTQRERQAQEEEKKLEDQFKNPLKPEIADNRAVLGPKSAPITIVEYSDFECPYCSKGYRTVMEVKKKYGDKIRFIYKHLPLDFHPKAKPAAKYFEAIALQNKKKAYKFHDEIFENQTKFKAGGEKYMLSIAKKLGIDIPKLKKDIKSAEVEEIVDADIAEAKKFGITGTPGFLINGVALKGAYPASEFERIIERHLSKKN